MCTCLQAHTCGEFEDRCRSGKDEVHGSRGECHKHARRPTRLVIDHRTPAAMLASSIASHWSWGPGWARCRDISIVSPGGFRGGLSGRTGLCSFSECWNLQSIFSAGILDATIKKATGKRNVFSSRSGQAGLACSRFFEEGGLTGCRVPWNRAEGNCMGWTLVAVSL